jgi:hypothetical protein
MLPGLVGRYGDLALTYRLQPNPATLSHQLGLWTTLVLNWAKHNRVWEINTDAIDAPEVFVNKSIDRESRYHQLTSRYQRV